jgi:hypothetical protein
MELNAALEAARAVRAAIQQLETELRKVIAERDGPNASDEDPVFEAAEIALDELHGADNSVAKIHDRLREL